MPFAKNKFINISEIGADAVSLSEAMLKCYPLTKMCLKILGGDLLRRLQFGFFTPGFRIIRQGEKGKDLFLACNHNVNVIVNNQVVVNMTAPALLGDKGIVDVDSVRSASIAIAEGNESLVIKIPIGDFMRRSKDQDVRDIDYVREIKIYVHLFKEIQDRLFRYSRMQKELWIEVMSDINLLNTQLIIAIFNKEEEKDWPPEVWALLKQYMLRYHKFTWPDDLPVNVPSFIKLLRSMLEKAFPDADPKKGVQNREYQKKLIWKTWLERVAKKVIRVLPDDKLPISLGELELFNPRIYRMRMHNLLVSIEKKFMFKKIKPREEAFDPEKLKAGNFFKKKIEDHSFDLKSYLSTVKTLFILKNPNRVLSQLAQQAAQTTAKCENEFNASVSKMQHFLEKIKKISAVHTLREAKDNNEIAERYSLLSQAFTAYHKRQVGVGKTYIGQVRYNQSSTPRLQDLIRSCGSTHMRKNVKKAIRNLITELNLEIDINLENSTPFDLFYICEAYPENIIPSMQFSEHYWITITDDLMLVKGDVEFGPLQAGKLIGGVAWSIFGQYGEDRANGWKLIFPALKKNQPKDHMFQIMLMPKDKLPWRLNRKPTIDELKQRHLPVAQSIIRNILKHISELIPRRNEVFDKYTQVSEAVVTEKRIRDFERAGARLGEKELKESLQLVHELLGISLKVDQNITSAQLSKTLYNQILIQTKKDFSDLDMEAQGNKAYTMWRFIQSEIVSKVFMKGAGSEIKLERPTSIYILLEEGLTEILKKSEIEISSQIALFSVDKAYIQLKEIIRADEAHEGEKLSRIFQSIINMLEQLLRILIEEMASYQSELSRIDSIQSEFNVKEMQEQYILETVDKLRKIILHKTRIDVNESPLADAV